jgi:hypothetical protein
VSAVMLLVEVDVMGYRPEEGAVLGQAAKWELQLAMAP